MNKALTDYLSSVLRNEPTIEPMPIGFDEKSKNHSSLLDSSKNPFLVDTRFSLRLDEVV